MKRPHVEVVIDSLVLHGVDPRSRGAVGRALERELGRLLAAGGHIERLQQPKRIASLDAGAIRVKPTGTAESMGSRVAGAVYAGLTGART